MGFFRTSPSEEVISQKTIAAPCLRASMRKGESVTPQSGERRTLPLRRIGPACMYYRTSAPLP